MLLSVANLPMWPTVHCGLSLEKWAHRESFLRVTGLCLVVICQRGVNLHHSGSSSRLIPFRRTLISWNSEQCPCEGHETSRSKGVLVVEESKKGLGLSNHKRSLYNRGADVSITRTGWVSWYYLLLSSFSNLPTFWNGIGLVK